MKSVLNFHTTRFCFEIVSLIFGGQNNKFLQVQQISTEWVKNYLPFEFIGDIQLNNKGKPQAGYQG